VAVASGLNPTNGLRIFAEMLAACLVSSVVAGALGALIAWLADLGVGMIFLSYWATGTTALILTASLQIMCSVVSQWWWAQSISFRFHMILFQSCIVAGVGFGSLILVLLGSVSTSAAFLGFVLILASPAWLTYALDSHLGPPMSSRPPEYL